MGFAGDVTCIFFFSNGLHAYLYGSRGESFGCSDFGACCVGENWTSAGNGANTSSKLCHCVVIGVLNIYCNYSGAHLKKAAVNAHNQIKTVAHVSRKFAVLIQQ